MPDLYGPFDGTPWTQTQWYRFSPAWTPSGVLGGDAVLPGSGELPFTANGLTVSIGPGRAHVSGAGYERTGTPWTASVQPNTNTTLSRRDRIVLRRDLAAKTVTPVLRQGTPAASPTAPALAQDETGVFDLPLFSFLVPPNSGTTLTDVVDERAFLNSAFPQYMTERGRDLALPTPIPGTAVAVREQLFRYTFGAWRYLGGADPGNPADPSIRLIRNNQTVPSGGAGATMSGYTASKTHPAVTVQAGGNIVLNRAGLWSISGHINSDTGAAGTSAVSLAVAGRSPAQENTAYRGTGFAGAGILRQPIPAFIGYLQAGAVASLAVFQTNTADAAVPYFAYLDIALLG